MTIVIGLLVAATTAALLYLWLRPTESVRLDLAVDLDPQSIAPPEDDIEDAVQHARAESRASSSLSDLDAFEPLELDDPTDSIPLVSVGTDIAHVAIFHPDDLPHWNELPFDQLARRSGCDHDFAHRRMLAWCTQSDGIFDLAIHRDPGTVPPLDILVAFELTVRHGRLFVGGADALPSTIQHGGHLTGRYGNWIDIDNGEYTVTIGVSYQTGAQGQGSWRARYEVLFMPGISDAGPVRGIPLVPVWPKNTVEDTPPGTPPRDAAPFELEPSHMPVVAIRNMVLVPGAIVPLKITREASIRAVDAAMSGDKDVLLVCQKAADGGTQPANLATTGVMGKVAFWTKSADGKCEAHVVLLDAATVTDIDERNGMIVGHGTPVDWGNDLQAEALVPLLDRLTAHLRTGPAADLDEDAWKIELAELAAMSPTELLATAFLSTPTDKMSNSDKQALLDGLSASGCVDPLIAAL